MIGIACRVAERLSTSTTDDGSNCIGQAIARPTKNIRDAAALHPWLRHDPFRGVSLDVPAYVRAIP
jgi:hypothetical protein